MDFSSVPLGKVQYWGGNLTVDGYGFSHLSGVTDGGVGYSQMVYNGFWLRYSVKAGKKE
jgi:hypothetical protein